MIKVTIATTTARKTIIVEEGTTVAAAVEAAGFSVAGNTFHINGVPTNNVDTVVNDNDMVVAVPAMKAGC